jgi:dTDP-glucose 4,6-dehydratase
MRILITGGAGFAGHHLVEHALKNTDWEIVVLDKLTYASNGWNRLRDISVFTDGRVKVLGADITDPIPIGMAQEIGEVDYIVHMAAETHVDNSITAPRPFVKTNVLGTLEMLNFARTMTDLKQFVYFSTDEVFGPAPEGVAYKEWDRYNCTNPYSASKAGGEELVLAFANTYKIPVLISHTMNLFGERQHFEKFIPMIIKKLSAGETITIHASPEGKPGSRFYIHCRNMADAVLFLLQNHRFERDKINIVGEKETSNLEMAQFIADVMGKDLRYELVDFHSSRPGHDLRYALDGNKLRELGWATSTTFEQSLVKTIEWTLANPRWLEW